MKKLIYALTFLLLTIVPAAAQQLQKINPPGLSKPAPGTYTHIVRSGKMLFIAGQTPINASGQVIGSTMKEQLEQVMANLLVALKSQGADFSHVTKTTSFVTSIWNSEHRRLGCSREVRRAESSREHSGSNPAVGRPGVQSRNRGDRDFAVIYETA